MPNTSKEALILDNIIERITDEVVEIKHVNVDLGQLDFDTIMPGVKFPCCLIDIVQIQFQQMQDGQHGTFQMRCKLGFDVIKDTSGRSHDEVREAGLNYFDIVNKLYQKLQYYAAGGLVFDKFIRIRMITEKREDSIRIVNCDFKASYHDRSAD